MTKDEFKKFVAFVMVVFLIIIGLIVVFTIWEIRKYGFPFPY